MTPTRRGFLKCTGVGAAAFLGLENVFSARNAKSLPNIIFIMADDLGYGDLGCYGQKLIKTPRIDSLAEEGMRFTQCYAGSTVCAPSRSVLLTGKHTGHTTVRGNFGKGGVRGLGGGKGRVPLEKEDVTVAELLKRAGYVTGITGKWGLGEPGTPGLPRKQGFDEWFGYLNQRRAHTYYPSYIWKNEEKVHLKGNQGGQKKQYTHDMLTDFALNFIRRHKHEPFFLYVPYTIPHSKLEVPSLQPYKDRKWKRSEKAYAAMVTRMDRDAGRIADLLKELEIDEETMVFFCSDNGAANRWEGRFNSSGPLRGRKRDMYEGGIRTPMIVRWPGKVPEGVDSDVVWYFADVLPTLADIAGVKKLPEDIDGASVAPSLRGRKQDLSNRFLYWEFLKGTLKQAARRGDWKVVRKKPDAACELYNLKEDPGERKDLAENRPDIVAKFERYLASARTASPHWPVKGLDS